MKAYRIKGWDKHYENNRSRELKRPEWLPLPNTFEGRGFMELMDHPAGMSHYGAWCLLLAVASRMPTRGLLVSDSGHPLLVKDIARMTRGSAKVFDEALPRLIAIGWMEEVASVDFMQDGIAKVDIDAESAGFPARPGSKSADTTPHGAGIPQDGAVSLRLNGNGKGNKNTPAAAAAVVAPARPSRPPPPGGSGGARSRIQGIDLDLARRAVDQGDALECVRAFRGTRDAERDPDWLRDAAGMTVGELAVVLWLACSAGKPIRMPSGLRPAREVYEVKPITERRALVREAFDDLGIPMPAKAAT